MNANDDRKRGIFWKATTFAAAGVAVFFAFHPIRALANGDATARTAH